jgi:hypothetical protein
MSDSEEPRIADEKPPLDEESLWLPNERAQVGKAGLVLSLLPWLGVVAMFLLHPG